MRLIDLLTELKQSYEIGLVTNGVAAWQYDKLEAMGISQLFEPGSIFISEEVGYEKPDPEIFLKALEHFQVLPEEAVFVGDSWRNDIEGSSKVGIKSIWHNDGNDGFPDNHLLLGKIANIFELRKYL